MRIAIGSLTYPLPNGVTNSINTSVDGFVAAGHDVMILAPDYGFPPVRPEHYAVTSSLVGKTLLTMLNRKERSFAPTAGNEMQALLDQFDPDAYWLHSVGFSRNIFEREMIKSGKPSVLTYHTHVDVYGRIYGGAVGEQLMIKRSIDVCEAVDAIITPSKLMEADLKKFDITKPTYVIPTAIIKPESSYTKEELHERFKIPKNHKVLLSVGRVVIEKNIFALFKMVADLVQIDPKITLLMIGPGDLDAAKRAIKKYKIGRHVVLPGQVPADETKKCYGAADVFVFASKSETQGLVVGEAMIVGTPVVALAAEVQPEMYPDTVASIAQTEDDLAPLVKELLDDPAKAEKIGKQGKKFVEDNFSVNKMIERQIALFESLVGARV